MGWFGGSESSAQQAAAAAPSDAGETLGDAGASAAGAQAPAAAPAGTAAPAGVGGVGGFMPGMMGGAMGGGTVTREQVEMQIFLEEAQMRDSLRTFNSTVEECFDHCIQTFRSKTLDQSDEKCVVNCAGKLMRVTQRVGMRFMEYSQAHQQQQQQQQQQ